MFFLLYTIRSISFFYCVSPTHLSEEPFFSQKWHPVFNLLRYNNRRSAHTTLPLCLRPAFALPSLLSVEAKWRQSGDKVGTKRDETDVNNTNNKKIYVRQMMAEQHRRMVATVEQEKTSVKSVFRQRKCIYLFLSCL